VPQPQLRPAQHSVASVATADASGLIRFSGWHLFAAGRHDKRRNPQTPAGRTVSGIAVPVHLRMPQVARSYTMIQNKLIRPMPRKSNVTRVMECME
jgi:hypothetical protein